MRTRHDPKQSSRPDAPAREWTEDFLRTDALRALADAVRNRERAASIGSAGSSAHLCAAGLARLTERPVLLVVAHIDDADEAHDELNAVFGEDCAMRFPALETLPGESHLSMEQFAERVRVQRAVLRAEPRAGTVLICPVQALMQAVPAPSRLDEFSLRLIPGEAHTPEVLARWLDSAGYERVETVEEPCQYSVRGGILDVFPPGATIVCAGASITGAAPIRVDFFGDEIESLREFDLDTMGSDRRLDEVELVGADSGALSREDGVSLLDSLPRETVAVIHETMEALEQGRGYYERVSDARSIFGPPAVMKALHERCAAVIELNRFGVGSDPGARRFELPARSLPDFARDAAEAMKELGALCESRRVVVACQNDGERSRLQELRSAFIADAPIEAVTTYVHRGFLWGDDGDAGRAGALAIVPYHELFHRYETRRRTRRLRAGRAADAFVDVQPGDYVVHAEHGVARFSGLTTIRPRAPKRAFGDEAGPVGVEEYLTLEFAGRTKLHVPASQIELVQKYVGGFKGTPPLSTIGGKKWKAQKERVGESVRDLAAEMLRVQAARAHMPGVRYPDDTAWQKEFEAEFPYEETEDQLAALAEIKRDMSSARPMDRLVCGDVGYGKTELAIRAAFKAAEFGKQVAVLAPTTVLAEQHERTFRARFADYPFRVESVSRFKTKAEQNAVLSAVRRGEVDVVIGTHRLLSKDVRFADLGLVVIDEEQRFGVEHKQTLLTMRMTVDVLTLSATPIPRTLHMSMLGLRDISSLTTPPLDRRAVVTEVAPFNRKRVAQAIARELSREGQVFFVHNRVHNIKSVADDVRRLAPDARVVIGHGQMPPGDLEEVMLQFMRREADILVCTTIIESGIDIPTANTMFINDADRFGLADLHQLRGRVGRYKHRAYCYLLLPESRPVSEVARKRLRAIEEFSMLGAGFKIAMRDLEIRGAGNLLGPEQSGHIAAVGYDMYCRLLDRAVRELNNERVLDPVETTVDVGASGLIPKAYIPSDARRMEAYRRIARAAAVEEVDAVERDLADAYGEPPHGARRMLDLARVRVGARCLGVRSIALHEQDVVFTCEAPERVEEALRGVQGTVRTIGAPETAGTGGDSGALREVYFRPPRQYLEPDTLLTVLRRRLCGESTNDRNAPE